MGINFAYGGSGVLSSLYPTYPNISTQIQELRYLVNNAVVSKKLIASSTCVLVIAGNDYIVFFSTNPTDQVSKCSIFWIFIDRRLQIEYVYSREGEITLNNVLSSDRVVSDQKENENQYLLTIVKLLMYVLHQDSILPYCPIKYIVSGLRWMYVSIYPFQPFFFMVPSFLRPPNLVPTLLYSSRIQVLCFCDIDFMHVPFPRLMHV